MKRPNLAREEMDGFSIIEPSGDLSKGYAVDRFRRFVPGIETAGTDGCWVWVGAFRNEYPVYWEANVGGTTSAARWAYDALREPIDPLNRLERTCGNKSCVNPFHGKVVPLSNV